LLIGVSGEKDNGGKRSLWIVDGLDGGFSGSNVKGTHMKRCSSSLLVLSLLYYIPLYCQNYLNIRYANGSDKNVPFASLQTITFDESGGNINFRLTDATTQSIAFTALQKMTSADAGAGTLLPVELARFMASANHNDVELSWTTATEVNNYGFDIERSAQSATWAKIGFVEGSGTTTAPKEYSFADKDIPKGKYSYRLKQIDCDGKFHYTQAVEVNIGGAALKFNLAQNFPNPFNPTTRIAYQIPVDGFVMIKIYDVVGREVASLVNESKKAGSYDVTFDGSRLSSGVYLCKRSAAAYSSVTKMIITK
jgi:hypothetical protein